MTPMIPVGQESVTGRRGDRDQARSAQEGLARTVRELIATSESSLPPADKLDLLRVQLGTLQFWADQLSLEPDGESAIPPPHFCGGERGQGTGATD